MSMYLSECSLAVIVAYREDTTELQSAIREEGLDELVVRGPYSREEIEYSHIMRCFVNHANAWRIASLRTQPTIILEADFVPVRGFGSLPLPVPIGATHASLAYLYSVAPQIWDLSDGGVARGHAGGFVAYVVSAGVAGLLLELFSGHLKQNQRGDYYPFDSAVGYWLKDRGIESYLPFRQYGEHGGIPNPEHATAGLGCPHQADCLAGSLWFLPAYARGSVWQFARTRFRARLWGMLRLLVGRYAAPHDIKRGGVAKMLSFSVGRQLYCGVAGFFTTIRSKRT